MRRILFAMAAVAALGFAIPAATSASAQDARVVIKSGDRGHHHGMHRHGRSKKVVVIRDRRDRGYHRGHYRHRDHRADSGTRVIIRHSR